MNSRELKPVRSLGLEDWGGAAPSVRDPSLCSVGRRFLVAVGPASASGEPLVSKGLWLIDEKYAHLVSSLFPVLSPWRIVDDCGGAFTMGTIGGGIFQAIKGFRNSPVVSG